MTRHSLPCGQTWAAGTVVLLCATAGCSSPRHPLFKDEQPQAAARKQWDGVRAKVKLQLAQSQFQAGNVNEALRTASEAAELDAGHADAFILLARIQLELGQLASARQAIQQAWRIEPASADVVYISGIIAERCGDRQEALRCYTEASERAPTQADYLAARVEALVELGRTAEALELLDSKPREFCDEPRLSYLSAEVYRMLGLAAPAVEQMRDAARTSDSEPWLQDELASTLAWAGRDVEAIGVLESNRARRLGMSKPSGAISSPPPSSAIDLTLARCYYRVGRLADASATLRDILQEHPDAASAWLLMARIALDKKDWTTAREAADRMLRLAPERAESHLMSAYVRLALNDAPGAIRDSQAAIDRDARNATAYCLLGQAFEAAHDPGAARQAYVKALTLEPDCDLARALLQPLDVPPTPSIKASVKSGECETSESIAGQLIAEGAAP